MNRSKHFPLAVVEEGAQIGERVVIEPYAVVKKGVILEDDVVIKSYACLEGSTRIGRGTTVWSHAAIGAKPQDLKYRGELTHVHIGADCEIREFVTINASCGEGTAVEIGDRCLIMASCHIAHNCQLGHDVIMANQAILAGHVIVEDFAIIGGMTPVAQYVRIGTHAMVGGMSRVSHDVPPYSIGGGSPYKLGGINLVGLKRRKFPLELRNQLARIFNWTYRAGLSLEEALATIEREIPKSAERDHWLSFCRSSKKGLIGFSEKNIRPKKPQLEEVFSC